MPEGVARYPVCKSGTLAPLLQLLFLCLCISTAPSLVTAQRTVNKVEPDFIQATTSGTISLSLSSNSYLTATLTCSATVGTFSLSTNKGEWNNQKGARTVTVSPDASAAGAFITCSYALSGYGSGNNANVFSAVPNTVIYVSCSMSGFYSVNLMLQTQPQVGLPCRSRQFLKAYYPFTNGQCLDASPAGINPSTTQLGYVTDKWNNANSAGSFVAGSKSLLVSPYSPKLNAYAISFWFLTSDTNANLNCVVDTTSPPANYWDRCLRLSSGKITIYLNWNYNSNNEMLQTGGSTNYADSQWHHVVYQHSVPDNQKQILYVDNKVADTGSKYASTVSQTNRIFFAYTQTYGTYSTVYIDQISIYERMLDSTEIAQLFQGWQDQLGCYTCGKLTGYTTTTPYPNFLMTPYFIPGSTGSHSLTVNGALVVGSLTDSTAISSAAALIMGVNYVTISSPEGDYVFQVMRVCDVTSIVLSPALPVTPSIACGTYAYSATVPYTTSTFTVTVTFQTTLQHKLTANGATVTNTLASGVASGAVSLKPYANTITVTAPEANYVFTIFRKCDISAISFTPAITISPVYACGTSAYTATVGMIVSTLAVTATFATGSPNYYLNGIAYTPFGMSSGVTTDSGLTISGMNSLTLTMTDGPTVTISITRLSDVSSIAWTPDSVTMIPGFWPGVLGTYYITVPFSVRTLNVTAVFGVGTLAFVINGVTMDPSMTLNQPSLPGALTLPNSYFASYVNTVTLVSSIDGTYTILVTVQPQDVRGFSLQCTTVYGATGVIVPIPVTPGQINIQLSMHARYDTCTLAITYQSPGTVIINSPTEPWSGSAASSTSYSTGHSHIFTLGVPMPMTITSWIDGPYYLTILRNAWDVQSLDMQVGGGPNSQLNMVPLAYTPTFIQSTPYYSATVTYASTGVFIRAMSTKAVSAELIRSGGYLVNMMPTGWTAPFPLNVGPNLFRIISANDNGSPYPTIGYTSYNFTITRTASALTGIVMAVKRSVGGNIPWESNIQPPFNVNVFTYYVDVPLLYQRAKLGASSTNTNNVVITFAGTGYSTSVTTPPTTYTSNQILVTGAASAGVNYFTLNSAQDGLYTVYINRPIDVQSIVAYADGGSSPYAITPTLLATLYEYQIVVPFKTQSLQLMVNFSQPTTLQDSQDNFYTIVPNVNTISIPTSFASPALLSMNNSADGVYTITIVYQPADVTNFLIDTNLGPLTLVPPFAAGTYSYTASYYGALNSLKLTTTYSTAQPQVNLTSNGDAFGSVASGAVVDLTQTLAESTYMLTGIVTLKPVSPYDGQYSITVTPACPQPYTVIPGTAATPLCQFFASYCKQPTSGYTRVCMLARPGCCGSPACAC